MTKTECDLFRNETCQLCGKLGQIVKIYQWIPKQSASHETIPDALAALTLDNSITDIEWTADTNASTHMTSKVNLLDDICKYHGTDTIIIGDSTTLPITNIGNSSIKQKHKLPLRDVLLVSNLKKNLLSISQLISEYPVNYKFFNIDVCIKE